VHREHRHRVSARPPAAPRRSRARARGEVPRQSRASLSGRAPGRDSRIVPGPGASGIDASVRVHGLVRYWLIMMLTPTPAQRLGAFAAELQFTDLPAPVLARAR